MAEPGPRPDTTDNHKWRVLVSVLFGIFMVILDTTVVNVAFQTLRREYGASLNDAQWIISIYVLALGISTPLAGALGDRLGAKRIYILGLGIFAAGSVASGLAPGLWWLVAARAFQGFGGGIALPLGTALLFRAFPEEEQGLALGMLGVALVTAPALGPILGGWLVDQGLWHWIFFINVPIAAVGLTLASRFLVEWKRGHRGPVDLPGLVTEVIGFGAVLYGASIAADRGWTAPAVVLAFGVGLTGLVWFAFVELFVSADPLLDLRLYRKRIFLVASLVGYVSVIALFGAEFLLPVYLQSLRGYTALQTGFILLPLAVAAGITLPVAGRLYDRIGPRVLLAIGFSVLAVNTWQLSLLEADTTIRWIAFLLVLRGFALGMTVQTTFVTALSVVPLVEIARGSSLTNATRQVVQSIGVAVLATILASTLSPEVRAMSARIQGAEGVTTGPVAICDPEAVAAVASPLGGPDVAAMAARACQESVGGFERAYRVTFYFALLALIIGVTLPGWPLAWGGRRSADRPPMVE